MSAMTGWHFQARFGSQPKLVVADISSVVPSWKRRFRISSQSVKRPVGSTFLRVGVIPCSVSNTMRPEAQLNVDMKALRVSTSEAVLPKFFSPKR